MSIDAGYDAILDTIVTKVLPSSDSTTVHARTPDSVIVNYTYVTRTVLSALPTHELVQGADLVTQKRIEFKLTGNGPTRIDWRAYTAEILADGQERRIYFTGIDFRFVRTRLENAKRSLESHAR